MTWDNSKYVKLLLEREEGEQDKYLIALRTTADYYGWTKHFPAWTPRPIGTSGGYVLAMCPGMKGEMFCEAGTRLRISRAKNTNGWPRAKTNAFKVSNNCTLWDIAEVAHFTEGDWYWMTSPTGTRILRGNWEARYQTKTPKERRGLVSA